MAAIRIVLRSKNRSEQKIQRFSYIRAVYQILIAKGEEYKRPNAVEPKDASASTKGGLINFEDARKLTNSLFINWSRFLAAIDNFVRRLNLIGASSPQQWWRWSVNFIVIAECCR